jgi:hypothetical protein
VNKSKMSEFMFLYLSSTMIGTMASLLPVINYLQTNSYNEIKQMCCNSRKKNMSQN